MRTFFFRSSDFLACAEVFTFSALDLFGVGMGVEMGVGERGGGC